MARLERYFRSSYWLHYPRLYYDERNSVFSHYLLSTQHITYSLSHYLCHFMWENTFSVKNTFCWCRCVCARERERERERAVAEEQKSISTICQIRFPWRNELLQKWVCKTCFCNKNDDVIEKEFCPEILCGKLIKMWFNEEVTINTLPLLLSSWLG